MHPCRASGFVLCFCAGTRITTPAGAVLVEELAVGQTVLTKDHGAQAIVWIETSHGRSEAEGVVIVRAGALGEGMPTRDLRVTPGHAFLFGDVLVPIGQLINGSSILWDDALSFEVYHVALAEHGVLIAEGAFAESYRDDGNRRGFDAAEGELGPLAQEPCRPVIESGPVVDALWRELAERAGAKAATLTREADVHLLADGRRIEPVAVEGHLHRFRIEEPVACLQIGSRSAVPAYLGYARDARRLGVAVGDIVIEGARERRELPFHSPALNRGFNDPEQGFRWTRGVAHLPPACFAGLERFEVTLDVRSAAGYAA